MPPLADHSAERIAIIKPSALGDIVHALPVLTALRQRYPHAHITWVVNSSYAPLLEGHPDLDALLAFDRRRARSPFRAILHGWRLLRALRRGRFDLAIDLQGLFRSGLMARATGAKRRVGPSNAREGATWFYTDIVPVAPIEERHAVERNWQIAQAFGAVGEPRFRLPVQEASRAWVCEALAGLPRPWLVLAPGSRWITKRWLPEHFGELARRAQERFGGSVIFLGAAEESRLGQVIAERLPGPWSDLLGRTDLAQVVALLAEADVVLCNDSGPLHIAAALGRPVVAPYTCTRVALHGPYGAFDHAVATRVECAGSYLRQCPHMRCMQELTPERLWPVLEEVLTRWQQNRRSA
jgi:lipopolysaccharide heptosyltransferase I